MADKIKVGVSLLLIAAGIAGFYYLQERMFALRLLSVLVGLLLATAVFLMTEPGRRFFAFGRESVAETKRVVWPTGKETMQTTAVVVVFAITMAVFLWLVDAGLMLLVDKLKGWGG